jgi:hypothetical protein
MTLLESIILALGGPPDLVVGLHELLALAFVDHVDPNLDHRHQRLLRAGRPTPWDSPPTPGTGQRGRRWWRAGAARMWQPRCAS